MISRRLVFAFAVLFSTWAQASIVYAPVQSLTCSLYDLATAQTLDSQKLALYSQHESALQLEFAGVSAIVVDRPEGSVRRQILKIANSNGHSAVVEFTYALSDIGHSHKFPHAASEVPGLGDTVFLYCR